MDLCGGEKVIRAHCRMSDQGVNVWRSFIALLLTLTTINGLYVDSDMLKTL